MATLSQSLDDLSERVRGALDLAQSVEDAAAIIERIHPPGRGATAFQDSPWGVDRIIPDGWVGMILDDADGGDEPAVHPSRWPGGIGDEPVFGEPA